MKRTRPRLRLVGPAHRPDAIRPVRSTKLLRRSLETDNGLGYQPTRIARAIGRRFDAA
jgi:hypothetical protein